MVQEKKLTGYPSIDKPWLKFYSDEVNKQAPPSPDCSMIDFLRRCSTYSLDLIALNYFGAKISYGALFEIVDRVAAALQKMGVKRGDIVSLCGLNTPEFVALLYAVNKVGAVSNWLGLTSPVTDLREQLSSTGTRLVFAVDLACDLIKEASRGTKVETIISVPPETSMPPLVKLLHVLKSRNKKPDAMSWKTFLDSAGSAAPQAVEVKSDELAMIEYTGGSTGVPKGVMLSNKALNTHYVDFFITNSNDIFAFDKADRMISGIPFFLVFGMCACCHSPLCHGMELVLAPDPSPNAGTKLIKKYKINHVMGGRLLIEELLRSTQKDKGNLSYIKSIMYGGEETNKAWENNIRDELRKYNFNATMLNSYGMSETAAGVLTAPDNATDGLIPCAGIEVKIVNPENCNEEYSYGKEGELCISTGQIMLGYFDDPKDTEDVFFEENGVRWLKTHDLAEISTDGIIKITGRIKRIYSRLTQDKIQIRVYPMRIEETLIKNELVQKCAVVGIKNDETAYRTIAYVIPKTGADHQGNLERQIDLRCRAELPESHVPDEYVFVDGFPLTRAGKIDYRALEQMAEGNNV